MIEPIRGGDGVSGAVIAICASHDQTCGVVDYWHCRHRVAVYTLLP